MIARRVQLWISSDATASSPADKAPERLAEQRQPLDAPRPMASAGIRCCLLDHIHLRLLRRRPHDRRLAESLDHNRD